jgi:hypothetical protein
MREGLRLAVGSGQHHAAVAFCAGGFLEGDALQPARALAVRRIHGITQR